MGRPFAGRSGRFLRKAVSEAGGDAFSVYYNNAIACKPQDVRRGPIRSPERGEAEACQPRIETVLQLTQPRAVVLCGNTSADHVRPLLFDLEEYPLIWQIPHPAWITRSGDREEEARYVYRLRDLFKRLTKEREKATV